MKTGIRLVLSMLVCSGLSACAKSKILNTLEVKVTEQAQQQYVSLSAKLNLGNAVLDQLQIPVRDPRTGLEVGSLGLDTAADGLQQVSLNLNASVMLHADPALGARLPNGRELPVTLGAAAGEVLGFPILQHSRVYIGGDLRQRAYIGIALAIKALDGVANLAGAPANIFFGMQVSPALYGVAGLYGSPSANESGIAVFGRLQLQGVPAPSVLTMAREAASRVKESAAGLAGAVSDQAMADADQLHPRSERKVTNIFYGQRRVLKVQ